MSKNRNLFLVFKYLIISLCRSKGNKLIIPALTCLFLFSILSAQEEFKYNSQGRRDPFIPLVTSDGRLLNPEPEQNNKQELMLEGIIYDKNGMSYAIINGSIAKVGEKIGEFQVLKINNNKVTFIKNGQLSEIKLKEEE
ncbi:MAG: hypothetical protein V2A64_05440 [Candidatus Omnitrophota bacterium]